MPGKNKSRQHFAMRTKLTPCILPPKVPRMVVLFRLFEVRASKERQRSRTMKMGRSPGVALWADADLFGGSKYMDGCATMSRKKRMPMGNDFTWLTEKSSMLMPRNLTLAKREGDLHALYFYASKK